MSPSGPAIYLLLALFILPTCNMLSDTDSEEIPLVGTKLTLRAINPSYEDRISVEDGESFAIFYEGGTTVGKADCNTCHGDYTAEGSSLDISFARTRAYCGEASKGDEFQLGLLEATAYRISGDRLTITTDAGQLILQADR